jgi:hypothetical protein
LISGPGRPSVAALTFATIAAIRLAVDIALAGVTLLIMRPRSHNDGSAAVKGWALCSLPAVALLAITIAYLTSLPSGCPV